MKPLRHTLFWLVLTLICQAGFGQNLTVVPMARSALVELNIDAEGAGNAPASSVVEWRTPDGTWKKAQPLRRVQNDHLKTKNPPVPLMATILVGLEEGKPYEVRTTCSGTGYTGAPGPAKVFTTLTSNPPAATGVVIPVTVDENSTSATIFNAINAALSATNPAANAGKVVEFRSSHGPGVRTVVRASVGSIYDGYRYWRWSGTPQGWVTLRMAAGHNIIFEGSSPTYDVVGKDLWEPYEDVALGITAAMGIYRTKAPVTNAWCMYAEETLDAVPVRIPNVTTGQRWAATSGTSSTAVSTGLPTLKDRAVQGEYAFCKHTDNLVYLRLPGGADPDTVRIKLPYLGACIDIALQDSAPVKYVVIDGLRMQSFMGNVDWAYTNGGVGLNGVDSIVLKNLDVRACPEYVKGKSSAGRVRRNVVIQNCLFREKSYRDQLNWFHTKFSSHDNIGIDLDGRSLSVLDSTVQGVFNGWSATGKQPTVWDGTQLDTAEALEFDNCTWLDIGDDALEPEQFGLGYSFTRNKFERCYKGVSMAPVSGGPVYILRNLWLGRGEYQKTGDRQAFSKFGNDDPGDTGFKLFANNTIVNLNDDAVNGKVLVGVMDSGRTSNAFIWNNYVSSDGFSIECGYGSWVAPMRLDGNVYRQRRPTVNLPNTGGGIYAPEGTMIAPPLGTPSPINGAIATQYWYYTGADRGVFAVIRRLTIDPGENPADMSGNRYFASSPAGFAQWQSGLANPAWPAGDWLFDPHSHYYVGTHELVNPYTGDFRPATGSTAVGAGQHLDGITRDVGPAWAALEEGGLANPTAGALLSGGAVIPQNRPPTITLGEYPKDVAVGQPIEVPFTTSDPDNDPVTVSVVVQRGAPVATMEAVTSPFKYTPMEPSPWILTFTASDGKATARVEAYFTAVQPNRPPAITLGSYVSAVTLGSEVVIPFTTADPDNDPVTVSAIILGDDRIITIDAVTSPFKYTPTVSGPWTLTFTASDGKATATAEATVTILPPPNHPPLLSLGAYPATVKVWDGVTVPFIVTDADNDTVTVTGTLTAPGGAITALEPRDNRFEWAADTPGDWILVLNASDGKDTTSVTAAVAALEPSNAELLQAVKDLTQAVAAQAETIKALQASAAASTAEVALLKGQLTTAQTQLTELASLPADLSKLSGTVEGLTGVQAADHATIAGLTTSYTALSTAVTGLNGDFGALSTKVTGLTADYGTLGVKAAGLETSIASLNTSVASLNTSVASINTRAADTSAALLRAAELLRSTADAMQSGTTSAQ